MSRLSLSHLFVIGSTDSLLSTGLVSRVVESDSLARKHGKELCVALQMHMRVEIQPGIDIQLNIHARGGYSGK